MVSLLKASEEISIMIHGLEERGIELTKKEDEKWLQFTDSILKERRRLGLKYGEDSEPKNDVEKATKKGNTLLMVESASAEIVGKREVGYHKDNGFVVLEFDGDVRHAIAWFLHEGDAKAFFS